MNQTETCRVFCENIKQIRSAYGFSKKEMAKKLKISTSSLSMIEKGILPSRLSSRILFHIQQNLHITPKDIFTPNFLKNTQTEKSNPNGSRSKQ